MEPAVQYRYSVQEFDRMMWLRLNFFGPNPAEKSVKFVRSLVFKTLLYRAEGDGQLPR
ncbi:Hypothetical predicted protein, partial [Pelobates cultripes]